MPAPTVRLVIRSMMMKAPVAAITAIAVKGDWLAESDGAASDFIEVAGFAIPAVQRIDIDLVPQRTDGTGHYLGRVFE